MEGEQGEKNSCGEEDEKTNCSMLLCFSSSNNLKATVYGRSQNQHEVSMHMIEYTLLTNSRRYVCKPVGWHHFVKGCRHIHGRRWHHHCWNPEALPPFPWVHTLFVSSAALICPHKALMVRLNNNKHCISISSEAGSVHLHEPLNVLF